MLVAELTGPFSLLVVDAVPPCLKLKQAVKHPSSLSTTLLSGLRRSPSTRPSQLHDFVEIMVHKVVARHGVSAWLMSDNGGNFSFDITKSFY
jgi:hypothetical protein